MSGELTLMHLTSSRFFGGPERQMLGLSEALLPGVKTVFASFSEQGLNRSFLERVRQSGFPGIALRFDTPRLVAARKEIAELLRGHGINLLICHGYKAATVGWFAARTSRIPVIAVSRGWTGENWKVRLYEQLDRLMLRRMDRVICVSQAQADKVQACGVRRERISVIRNSVVTDRFANPDPDGRNRLLDMFPAGQRQGIRHLVGAAGRLSPEKGFDVLVRAASRVLDQHQDAGFVLFGDGPERELLRNLISRLGISDRFVMGGFTGELDRFMPHFDLFVQSSHTEGLPNVLLESLAAGVPVVATDVGGTREVLNAGQCGQLVPPNQAQQLADQIGRILSEPDNRLTQAAAAREWVRQEFSFGRQAHAYQSLMHQLNGRSRLQGSASNECG